MTDQNQGASIEAEREYMAWLTSAYEAYNKGEADTLPDMFSAWQAARRTPAAQVGAGELPPPSIRTWEQRLVAKFGTIPRGGHLDREVAMQSEIADLRARLATTEQNLQTAVREAWARMSAQHRLQEQLAAKGQGEPVAQVDLENGNWMDVAMGEVPTWNRKKFKTRILYAAPASAQPADPLLKQAEQFEKYFALHEKLDVAYIADSLRVAAGAEPKHDGFDPDRAPPAKQVSDAQTEPGPWKVLADDDKPSAGRQIDVILQNGVCLVGRAYHEVDWSAVADWRYTNDIAAPQPAARVAVPDGWKLVPLEPTEAMVHAAEDLPAPRMFGKVYRAMLAASPATLAEPAAPTAIQDLMAFVDEYLDAWNSGMAGDSYLRRMAEAIKANTATPAAQQAAPADWRKCMCDLIRVLRGVENGSDKEWKFIANVCENAEECLAAPATTGMVGDAKDAALRNTLLDEVANKLEAMNDSSGDAAAYDNRDQNIYEMEREHAIAACVQTVRAMKSKGGQQ